MKIRITCPNCQEAIEVELTDPEDMAVCPSCDEEIELSEDQREQLRAKGDFDDIALFGFLSDGQIDGHFGPFG